MKTNKYQTKVFVASDHVKVERKFWSRLIVVSAIAIILFVGLGLAGSFEVENYRVANELETR